MATFDAFADLINCLDIEAAGGEPNIVGVSLAVPGRFDIVAGASLMEHKLTYLYCRDPRSSLARRFGFAPDRFIFSMA